MEGQGRVLRSEGEGDQTRFALEKHHSGYCAVDCGTLKGTPKRPLQGSGQRQLGLRFRRAEEPS